MLDALDSWYFSVGFKFVNFVIGFVFLALIWMWGYKFGRKTEARFVCELLRSKIHLDQIRSYAEDVGYFNFKRRQK